MNLTKFSIGRPIVVLVLFGLALLMGVSSFTSLRYELLPDISTPIIAITTTYPGASPREIEDGVSKIVENAVSSVNRVVHINTTSMENASVLTLELEQGVDLDAAVQDVQRNVNTVVNKLPTDAQAPVVSKFSINDLPILQASVTSKLVAGEFYRFMTETVTPRLAKLAGVGQVSLVGGNPREIKVNLDQNKLNLYRISPLQVQQAIKNANLDVPAGTLRDTDGQYVVRLSGQLSSLEELRNLVLVSSPQFGNIALKDVADVQDGLADSVTLSRLNGKEAIGLNLQKQSGANTVKIAALVKAELTIMEADYRAQGLKFELTKDDSVFTTDSVREVFRDILIAIVLVGLTMYVFLHSLRNTLIIMIAIPCTLLTTLLGVAFFNFSLNLISTLALTLVVGILVDDSIVVLENTHRHLEMGKDRVAAAQDGQGEIAFAAISITLVIVIAFLPLALVGGLIGSITLQFALVIIMATLLSLLVSFTMTPLLSSRFGRLEHIKPKSLTGVFTRGFDRGFDAVTNGFVAVLRWCLKHKVVALLITLVLLLASLSLIGSKRIGTEFITLVDRGQIAVSLELPQRSTLDQTNEVARQVEKVLFSYPEVTSAVVSVGAANTGFSNKTAANLTQLDVTLVPRANRQRSSNEVGQALEAQLSRIPGLKVKALAIGILGSAQDPIAYALTGSDPQVVRTTATQLVQALKAIPGTGQVRSSAGDGKPELDVQIDRDRMASLGLTLQTVGATLRVALTGNADLTYRDAGSDVAIRVVFDQADRNKTADVANISFLNDQGKVVALYQFAKVVQTLGPDNLTRRDRLTSVSLSSQAVGRSAGEIGADVTAWLDAHPLPPGVSLVPTGSLANQADSFKALGAALAVSVLFIYAILVILFNSWLYPIAVLFSIPVAFIGALVGLWLTHTTLNIFSILGILMLLGLVAKNAILLVDRTLKNQEAGLTLAAALEDAVRTRLRPIFMTTATMIFGMLPVALGLGSSGEVKASVGVVLIGGLSSSLVLTIFVVPIFQAFFYRLKSGRKHA
jgi:hydrophobe/amphiphile efflux-1 (HAE1) family protein